MPTHFQQKNTTFDQFLLIFMLKNEEKWVESWVAADFIKHFPQILEI